MPKYFAHEIQGQTFRLEGDVAHHLKHVLRVRTGEKVILCDGKSTDYHCVIESLDPLTLVIEHHQESKTELPCKITLYQGMPKADKLEWIIQKSVELGVHAIVPVYTEHCVVRSKPSGQAQGKQDTKLLRYQKISEAAAGQSMRGIIPKIHSPMSWKEAFEMATTNRAVDGLMLAAHEKEQIQTLKTITAHISASQSLKEPMEIGLWIGPEGGFSEKEIEAMEASSFKLVSLGPRILRAETAAIAAVAQIAMMVEGE